MTTVRLNDRDTATILAGLRLLQDALPNGVSFRTLTIMTQGGRHGVPTATEADTAIDELCARIGLGVSASAEQAA